MENLESLTSRQKYKLSEKGIATRKAWESRNKEKLKANAERYRKSDKGKGKKKQWKIGNKEKIRKWKKEWAASVEGKKSRRTYYKNNPSCMYKLYTKSAAKRQIEFTLNKEDFIKLLMLPCAYCGKIPLNESDRNGLDRVDNTKGYILDNVVPCCFDCNQMKGKKSVEHFLSHVKNIMLYQERKIKCH